MTGRELGFTRPADAGREGDLEHQIAVREHLAELQAKVLAYRVDAFYLAFQGTISTSARARLEAARVSAQALKVEVALELGNYRGALSPRSTDGWWRLSSAWLTVIIDERASKDWRIEVRPTALLLMHEGPKAALAMAREAARAFLENILGERVRRLDLCVDLARFRLRDIDVDHGFVCHHRTKFTDMASIKKYARAGKRTGFQIGKGDAEVCVYDKIEHLRLGLDEVKADDEYAEWRMGGWNGSDDVTRVEYRMRGRLLQELDLRDPETCLTKLDAVWAYCTRQWLRLVDPETTRTGSAQRKERCATNWRWRALQAVVFVARAEPAERRRAPTTPHALRMLSAALNYAAASGMLGTSVAGDSLSRVANWSPERCEAWVQEELFRMSDLTIRSVAKQWLARHDSPRQAAVALMEKAKAAVAKNVRAPEMGTDAVTLVAA